MPARDAISRRKLLQNVALAAPAALLARGLSAQTSPEATTPMYGLIGKMTTVPGQRDAFIAILLEAVGEMPGCLSYIVARDEKDADAIWITEVWDSKASHDASLALPAVKSAIARGRPLIATFGDGAVTVPVGGYGLPAAKR